MAHIRLTRLLYSRVRIFHSYSFAMYVSQNYTRIAIAIFDQEATLKSLNEKLLVEIKNIRVQKTMFLQQIVTKDNELENLKKANLITQVTGGYAAAPSTANPNFIDSHLTSEFAADKVSMNTWAEKIYEITDCERRCEKFIQEMNKKQLSELQKLHMKIGNKLDTLQQTHMNQVPSGKNSLTM